MHRTGKMRSMKVLNLTLFKLYASLVSVGGVQLSENLKFEVVDLKTGDRLDDIFAMTLHYVNVAHRLCYIGKPWLLQILTLSPLPVEHSSQASF